MAPRRFRPGVRLRVWATMRYPAVAILRTVSRDGATGRQLTFGDASYVQPDLVQPDGRFIYAAVIEQDADVVLLDGIVP